MADGKTVWRSREPGYHSPALDRGRDDSQDGRRRSPARETRARIKRRTGSVERDDLSRTPSVAGGEDEEQHAGSRRGQEKDSGRGAARTERRAGKMEAGDSFEGDSSGARGTRKRGAIDDDRGDRKRR